MATSTNLTIVTYEHPAACHMIADWKEEQRLRIISWEESDDPIVLRATLLPRDGETGPEVVYMIPVWDVRGKYRVDPDSLDLAKMKARVESNIAVPFYKWLHFGKVPCKDSTGFGCVDTMVHGMGKR